jgi:arylformamidase
VTEYRASFDAVINFGNGGDLTVHGFRVDVPGRDVDEAEIAALFVASLGLLMTDSAELSNVEVFAEPHKGTRGGPSDHTKGPTSTGGQFVELGHVIRAIDRLTPTGDTETHLVAPSHRHPDGADLGAVPLAGTVDLPAVVVRVTGAHQREINVGALAAHDVQGKAVLLHTGDDALAGTPAYAARRHFLTRAGAAWLADHGAVLVGIDGLDLDDTADGERAAHTLLLAAGIPVVAQLTGLDQLPPTGARFTAVPLRIEGLGTVPVRAFARLPA